MIISVSVNEQDTGKVASNKSGKLSLRSLRYQREDLKEHVAVTDHYYILLAPEQENLQTVIEEIGQMCKAS